MPIASIDRDHSLCSRSAGSGLEWAHPVIQEWFVGRFGTPTEPQEQGWPSILEHRPTLISAPTGSGKTLAAFLICIDRLLRKAIAGNLDAVTEVIYVSPLKALSNDIQKNLDGPLREIQALALERGYLCPGIRTAVRTGDTLAAERRKMLKRPPHILVTTPESLYILLTAEKSRENLRRVETVIVDEIHAVADDKRGAHLALTLERLDALVRGENRLTPGAMIAGRSAAPLRIGLSATQNPIELVAEFLGGEHGREVAIVQVGQRRPMDLLIEIPDDELTSVATNAIWDSIYTRMAELANEHRSTLVFVNTRRMVERLAFALGERLGAENVAAHHGSLSRKLRLEAERKLKAGEIRLLVATASLELGIDIGSIDLVCQVNSPRAIAAAMQRVGRAGHWRGAIPKGRLFVTTRDDLIESAALVRAMRSGDLDRLEIPDKPFDVLMQQIVAACAAEPWEEEALFKVVKRAHSYRSLTRDEFEELLCLLSEGIEASRGRYGAYLLRDRVQGRIQARRGARTIAVSNGGTIPDTALFSVIVQPEGVQIATLDEDFAVESSAGDVILLGNTSWRIQRVESAGRVLVEDAHGQPPNVPFWRGEAPQRTMELSSYVSGLRTEIDERTRDILPGYISQTNRSVAETVTWLKEQCGVDDAGAEQMIGYIVAGRAALGAVPSLTTIIAERFFDEGGGMQLILHAPFGGRINKAWGLALRKRFCRGFNFELQAAATDNGLNISLAEQHSFPLSDVFHFLTDQTVTELLEQASLDSPIFRSRWRWDAGRSLQLLRFQKGKRIAPQVQRTRSDDLLASVFPQVAACQENIQGDREIPNHPLIREVMKDVLTEAMDLEGLKQLLLAMESGAVRCLAVDTTAPSQFAHELLNANPYAFLDDAPLEERRARAVNMRGTVPDSVLGEAGRLDPAAIAAVREEIWPDIRDEHELHDLLCVLVAVPAEMLNDPRTQDWNLLFERLLQHGRAVIGEFNAIEYAIAAERIDQAKSLWPEMKISHEIVVQPDKRQQTVEDVLRKLALGWLNILGPVTSRSLGLRLGLASTEIWKAMVLLESSGTILRGVFEGQATAAVTDEDVEWCERRLLQRIHRRTLGTLRKQIEAVTPALYMQWLLHWQHLAPQTQLAGEQGVLDAIRGLEGFEAPAVEWERSLLPQRVNGYDPRWLDSLCMMGIVGWGRVSPHPAFNSAETGGLANRRIVPTSMAPITFFLREEALWMDLCLQQRQIPEPSLQACLSELAGKLRSCLAERGAMFSGDLVRCLAAPPADLQRALWELVAAGMVTADGFDSLRILIDPRRKSAFAAPAGVKTSRQRSGAGRWSLLCEDAAGNHAEREKQIESACAVLLRRYGIVFRDLLVREETMPRWRDLLGIFRRMEARGEVRGGRFLSGFGGEQFALPEAVESLRELRRKPGSCSEVKVAAADPLNLVDIVVPGKRVPAVPGKTVTFRNGAAVTAEPELDNTKEAEAEANEIAADEIASARLFASQPRPLRQLPLEIAGA
ncbi:DEAD/DEAH box helicase-like [Acidisarcina polymorpha]|uniref:DEAD/DEAH box helicase-like n=1 Tax=Acidisarcina polymorpha TaxID=2211140 RepID=A0A2Z5FS60_9BACT|nr:DEAD/DEAH box helicase [Acidisarcina polymorpha]AXC09583.1 DEAD/DEAH box helicase-like [Acidisarcina polymorpha]